MSPSQTIGGMRLLVNGVVQGVGFRPFIYRLAQKYELTGWVQNSSAGVMIEINGPQDKLDIFAESLRTDLPPLARIESLAALSVPPSNYASFEIRPSEKRANAFSLIPPDIAICDGCSKELFDSNNHRYRYPFINCTNCGPRFSIIQDMPYDRPSTTMSGFTMCPVCQEEYDNPLDRRFHAQPIACPKCGPQAKFIQNNRVLGEKEDAIQMARYNIKNGKIVAVKGLGGYLLACDASNENALKELRKRKHRSDKAFALMSFDLKTVEKYCQVSQAEAKMLTSRQMPVVILQRNVLQHLPDALAPGQFTLGMMLPYTPLHLLLTEPKAGYPEVLVMTSANISEEPIIYKDEDMYQLNSLADGYLIHDRPIHIRMDDSVVRFCMQKPVLLRRSRGYAPEPIALPKSMPSVLACGALLKNTFTLTKNKSAFMSPFIGDLENMETYASYEAAADHFNTTYKITPDAYACDLHPDFMSTQFATTQANQKRKPLIQVQHHHAHLAACLAENGWPGDGKAIGLTFDGTGLGNDKAIWGGEFLVGNYRTFGRACQLEYMPLPGGDTIIRNPGKIALAYMHAMALPWDERLDLVKSYPAPEREILRQQVENKINTVSTSSMGRLFDAVAALVMNRQTVTYEGQAAIEFEAIADPSAKGIYLYETATNHITLKPLFTQIIADILTKTPPGVISARFHNTLVSILVDVCQNIRKIAGIKEVALSGGVWQNMYLLEKSTDALSRNGFTVYQHHILPPNDGCISYGQAVIAGSLLQQS